MFLAKFLFRMKIMHKTEINHENANEFFKLSLLMNKKFTLSMTVISNTKNLLKKIAKDFLFDRSFSKIVTKLKSLINDIENQNDDLKIIY